MGIALQDLAREINDVRVCSKYTLSRAMGSGGSIASDYEILQVADRILIEKEKGN